MLLPAHPRRVAGPILILLCAWVTLLTSLLLADCFAVEVRQRGQGVHAVGNVGAQVVPCPIGVQQLPHSFSRSGCTDHCALATRA